MTKCKSRGNENTKNILDLDLVNTSQVTLMNFENITTFKCELLRFLYKEYEDSAYGAILGKKVFYCAIDNKCKKFCSEDEVLKFEEIYDLCGYHLERDTRLMFHMKHAGLIGPGNIVVRGDDTDTAFKFLCNVKKPESSHLCYNVGVNYNNIHEHIDITKLAKNMEIIRALPTIYAFTGNDYPSVSFRK